MKLSILCFFLIVDFGNVAASALVMRLLSGLNKANQTATTSDRLTISLVSYFLSLPLGGVIRATVTATAQTVKQKPVQGKNIMMVSLQKSR
jgi:hypothetical protein